MARQTSIEVYHQIEEEGLLSPMRFKVYKYLFRHGPATAGEVAKGLSMDRNSTNPRFAELKEMGAIIETGERACNITGRNVIEWDVSDQLPSKYERKQEERKCKSCATNERKLINLRKCYQDLARKYPEAARYFGERIKHYG